jgi:hypothetical protein
MAHEIPLLVVTRPAGADLTAKQFYFVELDTDGTVDVPSAAGQRVYGILQNKPNTGEEASILVFGVSKVHMSGAINEGEFVSTAADGRGRASTAQASGTAHTDTGDAGTSTDPLLGAHIHGFCVEPVGSADEIATCLICPMGAVPTTAV